MEELQSTMGFTKIDAAEHVINYKRNLAYYYEQKGQFDLAEHLLKELGEWTEDRRKTQQANYQDLILPE
jgi:hypothetical protein